MNYSGVTPIEAFLVGTLRSEILRCLFVSYNFLVYWSLTLREDI